MKRKEEGRDWRVDSNFSKGSNQVEERKTRLASEYTRRENEQATLLLPIFERKWNVCELEEDNWNWIEQIKFVKFGMWLIL